MNEPLDRIQKALDKSFKNAQRKRSMVDDMRWILFSDHHRGRRDGADDFLACEETYLSALEHYQKEEFTLCLLGDVEEFWENSPLLVMSRYLNVLQAEKKFYDAGRLIRIWGNHDDDWRLAGPIKKHLQWLFPKIEVHEAVILELLDDNRCMEILLVHGHQGSLNSDRLAWLSRLFVRFIWRNLQRLFKIPLSTPANNSRMKSDHDQAMYRWAERRDKGIICGHTHHPVFMSHTHADQLREELSQLLHDEAEGVHSERIKELQEKIAFLDQNEGAGIEIPEPKPFYFNTGCCSYSDGDITGLEISGGKIRLVKWCKKHQARHVLRSTPLQALMDYC